MKMTCENHCCYWVGDESELLTAPNPFSPGETLTACPRCRDIGSPVPACDEPGCNLAATCGTPTPDGYRHTCGEHIPKAQPAAPQEVEA